MVGFWSEDTPYSSVFQNSILLDSEFNLVLLTSQQWSLITLGGSISFLGLREVCELIQPDRKTSWVSFNWPLQKLSNNCLWSTNVNDLKHSFLQHSETLVNVLSGTSLPVDLDTYTSPDCLPFLATFYFHFSLEVGLYLAPCITP